MGERLWVWGWCNDSHAITVASCESVSSPVVLAVGGGGHLALWGSDQGRGGQVMECCCNGGE